METVLEEAQRLIGGDRQADYSHPLDNWTCIADMWQSLIKRRYGVSVPLTADFACLMMDAMKLSREAGKPKRDNRVDGAGYWGCADLCLTEQERRKQLQG